jgi:NADPH:quinone reductase-like Zn-dependent oxidoreductase
VFVGNAGGASLSVDLWPALQANQTLHGVFMGTQFEKPEVYSAVEELLRLAGAQQLEVLIDSCFPLSDAVLAHHRAEQRTLGRVVMLP